MNDHPDPNVKKPDIPRSGFFIFLLFACATAAVCELPSALLRELALGIGGPAAQLPARDNSSRPTVLFVSARYDDIYRQTAADSGASGETRETASLSSPRLETGIAIGRDRWGGRALARYAKIDGAWDEEDEAYRIEGSSPLHRIAFDGWIKHGRGRLSAGLGYDPGLPLDYYRSSAASASERVKQALFDPRLSHSTAATLVLGKIALTLHETKQPLLCASARIEKRSNNSFVEIPCAASAAEAGGTAGLCWSKGSCGVTAAYMKISSDTALRGKNVLPAQIAAKGVRFGGRADFHGIALGPSLAFGLVTMNLRIRGYDYGGAETFCRLDSNAMAFAEGRLTLSLPWNIRAGILAERFRLGNDIHGRFDPYPFSEFSIFDPVKYRIDALTIGHDAAGISLERGFHVRRRGDSVGAKLGISYVRSSGTMGTREYHFIFNSIPKLTNPKTWELFDAEVILFSPEISYTLPWRRLAFTAALRQLAPIDISSRAAAGGHGSQAAVRARGGTTLALRADYRL